MENWRRRLSSRVENYIKYRPRYPQPIIELLQRECHLTPTAALADIGSRTGPLTEVFLNSGHRVLGIEPDPEMRAANRLLQGYARFTSIATAAEATSLADHRVDVVTVSQAFQWFDREQARRKFLRILVPQGWVMLVWNRHRTTGTPFLVALEHFGRPT